MPPWNYYPLCKGIPSSNKLTKLTDYYINSKEIEDVTIDRLSIIRNRHLNLW